MNRDRSTVPVAGMVTSLLVLLNAIVLRNGLMLGWEWYLLLPFTAILLLLTVMRKRSREK
jgi:hypothetical protein